MRRGAQLGSERELSAALALVPELPYPKAYLIRTLRALADLYMSTERPADAAALFGRLEQELPNPTKGFWCDYSAALFGAATQSLIQGHVAEASAALEKVSRIREGLPVWAPLGQVLFQGYVGVATLFERAGEMLPAELYFTRAAAQAGRGVDSAEVLGVFFKQAVPAAELGQHARAERFLELAREAAGQDPALIVRVAAQANALAQAAWDGKTNAQAARYFQMAEALCAPQPALQAQLSDQYLAWGLRHSGGAGRPWMEKALDLRQQIFPAGHAKIRQAEAALAALGQPTGAEAWSAFRVTPSTSAGVWTQPRDAAVRVKRLQRRLALAAHPDHASGEAEALLRNELMRKVNEAASRLDLFALTQLAKEIRQRLPHPGRT